MEPMEEVAPPPAESDHGVLNAPKLLRLASMLNAGIEEARQAGGDHAAAIEAERAAGVLRGAVVEAGSAVADDLLAELEALLIRPAAQISARESSLVSAQLLGWLLGVLADPDTWSAGREQPRPAAPPGTAA